MSSVTIATPEECAEFEKKYRAAAETLFDPLDSVENDLKDICALTETLRMILKPIFPDSPLFENAEPERLTGDQIGWAVYRAQQSAEVLLSHIFHCAAGAKETLAPIFEALDD